MNAYIRGPSNWSNNMEPKELLALKNGEEIEGGIICNIGILMTPIEAGPKSDRKKTQ